MSKLLITSILCIFALINLKGQPKKTIIDSQFLQVNHTIVELENKIKGMELIITNTQGSSKEELELVMGNLKNATLIVEIMALLLAFFLAWLSILSFKEFKKGKKKFEKIKEDANEKLARSEIACNSVLALEKKLKRDLDYTKIGLESLFDNLTEYFSQNGNQRMRELVFMNSNICKLHSLDETTRFAGITALIYGGDVRCIEYLEKISLDSDETPSNKKLAIQAILAINKRANMGNKAA